MDVPEDGRASEISDVPRRTMGDYGLLKVSIRFWFGVVGKCCLTISGGECVLESCDMEIPVEIVDFYVSEKSGEEGAEEE